MSATDDDSEIIDETEQDGWSDELKDAKSDGSTTVYDPIRTYTAWITAPDSIVCEVER